MQKNSSAESQGQQNSKIPKGILAAGRRKKLVERRRNLADKKEKYSGAAKI